MKTNYKKILKFAGLLISALLIGTASAAVYNYMQITARVRVKGFDVNFYAGEDTLKAGGTISSDRQSVSFTNITGLSGQPVYYSDLIRICNNGTVAHNVMLEVYNPIYGGNAQTTLDYINITIYNDSSVVDYLRLDPHGDDDGNKQSTNPASLSGHNSWWRIHFEILWFSNATTNDYVDITLRITVEN